MPRKQTRFEWDNSSSRYRSSSSGRFVSADDVRRGLDKALEQRARANRALTEELRAGAISLDQWRREMRASIKDAHLYSAAAARGGYSQLSDSDRRRVAALVKEQFEYLEKFARDMENGLLLDGRVLSRAELYAQAARSTYERTRRRIMSEENGMREERSVLHGREHCTDSRNREGCIEQAAKGWVPIGTLVPIGERTCLGNCLCTMRYREGRAAPRIKPKRKS